MTHTGESGGAVRIVLVGHCMPDAYALRSAVRRTVPGATVVTANDSKALEA